MPFGQPHETSATALACSISTTSTTRESIAARMRLVLRIVDALLRFIELRRSRWLELHFHDLLFGRIADGVQPNVLNFQPIRRR